MSVAPLTGAGGIALHRERMTPPGAPRGVVLVAHGYGEHLGRYREFMHHLTGRGIAAVALDHRGHGRSGGARGHCRDFGEYVADLRLLADDAERTWPGVPRLLFGHSMGGLIAVLYLLTHPDTVRAAALSGPALRLPAGGPRLLKWLARVLGRLTPRLSVQTAIDAAALSRDPGIALAYEADPLVHRRASMGFARAIERAQRTVEIEGGRLRVPLLILQGAADRVVDPAGAPALAARLTCPHQLEMLPGYYHELLNEPPGERARVLALLDAWFDRWLAD